MARNSLYRRDDSTEAFTDILFNALLGFAFMFFIAFVLINPTAESGKIDADAEILITATWPDSHPDDIDTYVEDPAGNIVWYHTREAGLMHLDRDDRGVYRDTILFDGQEIANPLNQEIISIRGNLAGEYVVNLVHYIANFADPVPVSLKVEKLNPSVTVIYYGVVELTGTGHERTAVRFTLDTGGVVTGTSGRQKSLVELTRRVRRPGDPGLLDSATGMSVK